METAVVSGVKVVLRAAEYCWARSFNRKDAVDHLVLLQDVVPPDQRLAGAVCGAVLGPNDIVFRRVPRRCVACVGHRHHPAITIVSFARVQRELALKALEAS